MNTTGSCLCGTVRYEVAGAFKVVGHCHCSMCRKSHGAAFATWGIVDAEQFRWTAGAESVAAYASSPGKHRLFCARCGSPLAASHAGRITEIVFATLDGDPGQRPAEHVFAASRAPWHEICDALPRHGAWPPGADAASA